MKFDTNSIWGWVFFLFGSLLYAANQTYSMVLFANTASEIIFVLLCYAMTTLGISLILFEEFWTQTLVGFLSIFFIILILNASLLVYDAFNTFRYDAVDYFALFQYAVCLTDIPDEIALLLIAVGPSLGILAWWGISYSEQHQWYEISIFAIILFVEMIIFTGAQHINIFAI